MAQLRELLVKSLKRHKIKDGIELEFSGGCDSTSIFLCLKKDLKIKFRCHIYYLRERGNMDLYNSRVLCRHYGVKLVEYKLTEAQVLKNIVTLKADGYKGKVLLQCLAGHLPVARAMKNRTVLNASFADALYGVYKSIYMTGGYKNKKQFDIMRKKALYNEDADGTVSLSKLFAKTGNKVVYPYWDKKIIEYFLRFDYHKLNSPRKKKFFYEDFEMDIPKAAKPKRISQQIASGVKEFLAGQNISYR